MHLGEEEHSGVLEVFGSHLVLSRILLEAEVRGPDFGIDVDSGLANKCDRNLTVTLHRPFRGLHAKDSLSLLSAHFVRGP